MNKNCPVCGTAMALYEPFYWYCEQCNNYYARDDGPHGDVVQGDMECKKCGSSERAWYHPGSGNLVCAGCGLTTFRPSQSSQQPVALVEDIGL